MSVTINAFVSDASAFSAHSAVKLEDIVIRPGDSAVSTVRYSDVSNPT